MGEAAGAPKPTRPSVLRMRSCCETMAGAGRACREVADVHAALAEGRDDPEPRRMGEGLEDDGKMLGEGGVVRDRGHERFRLI